MRTIYCIIIINTPTWHLELNVRLMFRPTTLRLEISPLRPTQKKIWGMGLLRSVKSSLWSTIRIGSDPLQCVRSWRLSRIKIRIRWSAGRRCMVLRRPWFGKTRIGGYGTTLIGIENQPFNRLGQKVSGGPDTFAGGTLYPQASRKIARAINASSGRRPLVVLANLSGFDGSPESLRHWQLEYGAEIGRAVTNFDGPIVFVILSRYHGGAYVVFSKALNPNLTSIALEGSYASVIGGAPAAAVVFAADVRKRAAEIGSGDDAKAQATSELAGRFDEIHSVGRAQDVGSIDAIIRPEALRKYVTDILAKDSETQTSPSAR